MFSSQKKTHENETRRHSNTHYKVLEYKDEI